MQSTLLPESVKWYNSKAKILESKQTPVSQTIEHKDVLYWIKAGSILPLLSHKRELSLLRAIKNPIRLEIYCDLNQTATGSLVLDDGWSTKSNHSRFNFTFSSKGLLTYQSSALSDYVNDQVINEVVIFGLGS